jgi:hypothetical protein
VLPCQTDVEYGKEHSTTRNGKRELLEAIRTRYRRGSKAEKTRILDEFVHNTGYHRKYAIRLLNQRVKRKHRKKVGRRKEYQGEVVIALIKIWAICDQICSKRLHPFLPEIVEVLERQGELVLSPETKQSLLKMSRATIDRCLRPERHRPRRGLSTTKPGTLLKQAIPIRTFTEWDDARPGFVEIDLVAHCGDSTHGEYINTLTAVDVTTGWTECLPLANRSQHQVSAAIILLRQRLPFPLLGIDSDNDSAFINDNLYRYCEKEEITFTRSRPYKKNDQAHVEQKNWSVVRRLIGYDRYESPQALALFETIYEDVRLYINFFQPVLKLIDKHRVGSKLIKHYDTARTPYRRVLESPEVVDKDKKSLRQLYATLNPVTLRHRIDENVERLWQLTQ